MLIEVHFPLLHQFFCVSYKSIIFVDSLQLRMTPAHSKLEFEQSHLIGMLKCFVPWLLLQKPSVFGILINCRITWQKARYLIGERFLKVFKKVSICTYYITLSISILGFPLLQKIDTLQIML